MARTATGDSSPTPDEVQRELRQLALVDRILGLEAEVARLSILAPDDHGARGHDVVQRELRTVYSSMTWRVGSAVLAPARALRGLGRRLSGSK